MFVCLFFYPVFFRVRLSVKHVTSSQTSKAGSSRSEGASAGVAGNATFVCRTVCTGVGKRLHTLPSHPVVGETRFLFVLLLLLLLLLLLFCCCFCCCCFCCCFFGGGWGGGGTRINPNNAKSWNSQSSDSGRQQYFSGKVNSVAILCILTYTYTRAAPGPQTAGPGGRGFQRGSLEVAGW